MSKRLKLQKHVNPRKTFTVALSAFQLCTKHAASYRSAITLEVMSARFSLAGEADTWPARPRTSPKTFPRLDKHAQHGLSIAWSAYDSTLEVDCCTRLQKKMLQGVPDSTSMTSWDLLDFLLHTAGRLT